MQHRISNIQPWAWASVSAVVATVAIAGTLAEVARRQIGHLRALDPRAPFDPYYGLAEYALDAEPVSRP